MGGMQGGWWDGWIARGRLNPPLGLFGLPMSPKVKAIGPNNLKGPQRCITTIEQIHAFHVVPSMGSIVPTEAFI